MIRKTFVTLFAMLAFTSANAVVIDFSGFGSGDTGLTELVTAEATFTSAEGNFFIGAGGTGSLGFCALDNSAFSCESDFSVEFNGLATNLTVTLGGFDSGDFVEFFAFGIGGAALGSVSAMANGLVDLSGLGGITALYVDDSSTGAGFGYGDWTLDLEEIAVPAPAVVGLFGLGLLGVAFGRRRLS